MGEITAGSGMSKGDTYCGGEGQMMVMMKEPGKSEMPVRKALRGRIRVSALKATLLA